MANFENAVIKLKKDLELLSCNGQGDLDAFKVITSAFQDFKDQRKIQTQVQNENPNNVDPNLNVSYEQAYRALIQKLLNNEANIRGQNISDEMIQNMQNILIQLDKERFEALENDAAITNEFFNALRNAQYEAELKKVFTNAVDTELNYEQKKEWANANILGNLENYSQTLTAIYRNDAFKGSILALLNYFFDMLDALMLEENPETADIHVQEHKQSNMIPLKV